MTQRIQPILCHWSTPLGDIRKPDFLMFSDDYIGYGKSVGKRPTA